MPRYISRPRAGKKKIHSKNEFELCYLRHKYFRRVKYNPSKKDMQPYLSIASHLAKNTYFRYPDLFKLVGFEVEDVINIANVHLISFLGLYSLEKMPKKYKEFVKTFTEIQEKSPDQRDVLDKNQANFTLFLKQRMEDVVRVCRQKVKNIRGLPFEGFKHFYGPNKPPKNISFLLKYHDRFGFRKLDRATFKCIKKKAGYIHATMFDFNGNYYVAVPIAKKNLEEEDLAGAGMDPRDNAHNMNPEDFLIKNEETEVWKNRKEDFKKKPKRYKAKLIKEFIAKNKNNKRFSEEISTAKDMLERLM